jgi:hypothetical protein
MTKRTLSFKPKFDFARTYIFSGGQVVLPRFCLPDVEAAVSPTAAFFIQILVASAFGGKADMLI